MIDLFHIFGLDGTGAWYSFWSGIGSDLGEVALLGGLVQIYRSNRCHVDGCRRIGKHHVEHFKVCAKHHPGVPNKVTTQHIEEAHERVQLGRPGQVQGGGAVPRRRQP